VTALTSATTLPTTMRYTTMRDSTALKMELNASAMELMLL
jgi:hypothetical protein